MSAMVDLTLPQHRQVDVPRIRHTPRIDEEVAEELDSPTDTPVDDLSTSIANMRLRGHHNTNVQRVESKSGTLTPPRMRPAVIRRSTEPDTTGSTNAQRSAQVQHFTQQLHDTLAAMPPRPTSSGSISGSSVTRNRSPFSRSHLRSRSTGTALISPPPSSSRASMSPSIYSPTRSDFSSPPSPLRSSVRPRSPYRQDDSWGAWSSPRLSRWSEFGNSPGNIGSAGVGSAGVGLGVGLGGIEAIQEDSELELTPKAAGGISSSTAAFNSLPRSTTPASGMLPRRRPHSPLHSMSALEQQPHLATHSAAGLPSAARSASPSTPASQRFNEAYPSLAPSSQLHHSASTSSMLSTASFSSSISVPSTPTSARSRSRSPSISSLETIEDAPEMESLAIENDRLEKLRLAAERGDDSGDEDSSNHSSASGSRRGSFEGEGRSGRPLVVGFGFTRGGKPDRKRWSVCGGERRADLLDLETIYED